MQNNMISILKQTIDQIYAYFPVGHHLSAMNESLIRPSLAADDGLQLHVMT